MTRPGLALLLAAALAGCGRPRGEAAPPDARTAVPLAAAERAAVLEEMRTLLGSVDGVTRGLAAWDTAAIARAALRSGSVDAADRLLQGRLPEAWLRLATLTHTGFDSLGAAAQARGATPAALLARFAAITPQCVSCHAMYRLAAP